MMNPRCAVYNLAWEEHIIATDHHKLELECPTGDRVEIKWGKATIFPQKPEAKQ